MIFWGRWKAKNFFAAKNPKTNSNVKNWRSFFFFFEKFTFFFSFLLCTKWIQILSLLWTCWNGVLFLNAYCCRPVGFNQMSTAGISKFILGQDQGPVTPVSLPPPPQYPGKIPKWKFENSYWKFEDLYWKFESLKICIGSLKIWKFEDLYWIEGRQQKVPGHTERIYANVSRRRNGGIRSRLGCDCDRLRVSGIRKIWFLWSL